VLTAALPELLVVTQDGVLCAEPVGELGGEALLLGVPRPGTPVRGVRIEVLVDSARRAVGVPGVDADHAFVVVRDHDSGDLPDPHRQPVAVIDRPAEARHRSSEFGRYGDPAGHIVVGKISDSAHEPMLVALGWPAQRPL
jgi:hypothetical protein